MLFPMARKACQRRGVHRKKAGVRSHGSADQRGT
jgi:hypothetical protein